MGMGEMSCLITRFVYQSWWREWNGYGGSELSNHEVRLPVMVVGVEWVWGSKLSNHEVSLPAMVAAEEWLWGK